MADQNFINRLKQIEQQNAGSSGIPASPQPTQVARPMVNQPAQQPQQSNPNATPQGKIFTGSWWEKLLDIPQLPQYAYAGFLKGGYGEADRQKEAGTYNSNGDLGKHIQNVGTRILSGIKAIPSGIENRTSFNAEPGNVDVAEKLGIENPYAKGAYNLGLSLAMPSLPVGKIAKATGVSNVVGKVTSKAADALRGIQPIAKAIENVNPFFRNPEAGKIIQEADKAMQSRLNDVYKVVQTASEGLTPAEQMRVGQILEGSITTDPGSKFAAIAEPIRRLADEVGAEAVKLGLLNEESFNALKGKYMSHIWEEAQNVSQDFSKGIPKIDTTFYKQRKGAEGYIKQFGPAVFKGIGTEVKNNEIAKLYKNIIDKFGVAVENTPNLPNPENFVYAPDVIKNSKMGQAFGKILIPKEVADYLTELATTKDRTLFDKVYDFWKKGKTIYNPAYHVRNNISNQILSDMSTGEGVVGSAVGAAQSAGELAGKGDQTFVQVATDIGLIGRKNFGEMYGKTLETAGLESGAKKTIGTALSSVDKGLTGFQNKSEEAAKLNVFKSWINKFAQEAKVTVQEALQDPEILNKAKAKAEEAIFSPYNISSKERGLVKRLGIPFYSFARQSIPFIGKTYLDNPGRITKYEKYKTAVEGLTPEDSGQAKPEWADNAVRLPVKDKEGKNYSFDPSYIYPFGNLGEGQGGRLPLGLSLSPFITEYAQQAANKDFYFDQPIAKSNVPEKATKQRVEHAIRTFAPQLYSTLGIPATGLPEASGKLYGAATGKPDFAGRTRSPVSAILDAFGFKNSVLRPEEQASFDAKDKRDKIKSIQSERTKTSW